MSRNLTIQGDDSRPMLEPVFCYVIRDNAGGQNHFLANWDEDIEIAGLPAKWGGADPQTFTGARISHGSIEKQNGLSDTGFVVAAQIHDIQDISRYLIFGMIPKIEIGIIKVSAGVTNDGTTAEWGVDTQLIHSGLLKTLKVDGFEVSVECVPEPMLSTHQVPRWRFTRTCNHPLYSTACAAAAASFSFGNSVLSLNIDDRKVTISGQKPGVSASYWRQGVMVHTATGVRLTILNAEHNGGNTIVQLHQWTPDLALTDSVTLYAGCDHTAWTCERKFSNLANFGGFPMVPNKNMNLHGVD